MGHSSITVTLDRYGHLFPGLDERIADGLDDTLRHSLPVTPRSERGQAVVNSSADHRSRRSTVVGAEGLEPPTPSL